MLEIKSDNDNSDNSDNSDDYLIGKFIGRGVYGEVRECTKKSNNQKYAMKKLNGVYYSYDEDRESNYLKLFDKKMNLCSQIDLVKICGIKHIIIPLYTETLLNHIYRTDYKLSKETVFKYDYL